MAEYRAPFSVTPSGTEAGRFPPPDADGSTPARPYNHAERPARRQNVSGDARVRTKTAANTLHATRFACKRTSERRSRRRHAAPADAVLCRKKTRAPKGKSPFSVTPSGAQARPSKKTGKRLRRRHAEKGMQQTHADNSKRERGALRCMGSLSPRSDRPKVSPASGRLNGGTLPRTGGSVPQEKGNGDSVALLLCGGRNINPPHGCVVLSSSADSPSTAFHPVRS